MAGRFPREADPEMGVSVQKFTGAGLSGSIPTEDEKEGGSDRRNWAVTQSQQKLQQIPEPGDGAEPSCSQALWAEHLYLSHSA